ncbi:alkaline-phosphatase-like protein [Entophlyctis helioformis]|nr:alkaline-phosphatase-like protein [Entophlyctis helioformis]
MQPRQGGWASGWISLGSRAAQPSQQDRRVRRKRAASPASAVLRSCLSRSAVGICAAVLLVAVLCVALLARPGGWPSDDTRSLLNELRHTVILVSLDGFRPDYLDRGLTPNLNRLARQGVRAVGMQPAFPSVTFPNHYTIVTGLYPESHGVVGNTYYDPIRKSAFEYTNPEMNADGYWWNGGEPIWVTAVKQGKRAATCMWPGSEAEIRGVRPTHWLKYNGSMSLDEKIDHVVSWLDLPRSQRPSFLSLYISDVDGAGHTGGIHSDLVASALQRVDNAIGRLHRLLEARHIADLVNLIIVSDHGMADTSTDRVIFLDDYVSLDSIRTLVNGPVWSVYPTTATQAEAVLKQLADGASTHGHFKTFLRSQVPSEYHFQQSDRIAPILVVADPDWSIAPSRREFDPQHPPFPKGMHGYNNSDAEMQALFLAHGSAFKRPLDGTARIPSFANTEVYQMLAKLIGVEAAPNNGSRAWLDAFSADWLAA